ncbi:MAG: hypothetical protein QM723_28290 [Myxococcaceae bacterium]
MSEIEALITPGRPFLLRPNAGPGVSVTRAAAEAFFFERVWTFDLDIEKGERFTELAKVGSRIEPRSLLIGRVDAEGCDSSRIASLWTRGVVTEAAIDGDRAEVKVMAARPLALGDQLRLDDGSVANVSEFVEALGDADLAWPFRTGNFLVSRLTCAADQLEARSIGPYSIVTQQPLGGRAEIGGQKVGPAELTALLSHGARATVDELLTLKCDDVAGRVALYEALVRGTDHPKGSLPRSAKVLELELRALGFDVDFTAPALHIHLFGDERVRTQMPGVVRKPETLNYRTLLPEKGGLFCEEVFGALKSTDRAQRMAHLEFPVPVVHPWAREAVGTLLNLSEQQLDQVLQSERALDGADPQVSDETGSRAVHAALEKLDLDALAEGDDDRARLARQLKQSETRPVALCPTRWPVLPPDLRPLVPLRGGRFATSDLNDLYRRVINRSNRMRRLLELNAPEVILRNESWQLQTAVDALVENGAHGRVVTGPNQRPLKSLADVIGPPTGRLATELPAKRVDYSGAAPAVPVAQLGRWEVRLPRDLALEITRPLLYSALEQGGQVRTIKEAKKLADQRTPEVLDALEKLIPYQPVVLFAFEAATPSTGGFDASLWDEAAIGLSPATLEQLGVPEGGSVVVHFPLGDRARAEATGPLRGAATGWSPGVKNGWLSRALGARELGPLLINAALAGELDPLQDERVRMLLGQPLMLTPE